MDQERKSDRSPRPAESGTQAGGDLFIVDNSEKDWKVRRYLHDWAEISTSFDIATGCFEIGSLLALDGQWQKLDKIRILMGSETTRRTRQALLEALKSVVAAQLDSSIEKEKDKNDFLNGVPAVLDALRRTEEAVVQESAEVAHRLRRTHQHSQTAAQAESVPLQGHPRNQTLGGPGGFGR